LKITYQIALSSNPNVASQIIMLNFYTAPPKVTSNLKFKNKYVNTEVSVFCVYFLIYASANFTV